MNLLQYGYEKRVYLIYFKCIIFALCENNNIKRGTRSHLYPISGDFSGVRYPS